MDAFLTFIDIDIEGGKGWMRYRKRKNERYDFNDKYKAKNDEDFHVKPVLKAIEKLAKILFTVLSKE